MLPKFITGMDKQASRSIGVVLLMFILVAAAAYVGREALNVDSNQYQQLFLEFSKSDWAPFIFLMVFICGAFIGVPQWAMIAGMVFTFGGLVGGGGSWACTMISACLNFWLAKWVGAERVRQFGGDLINRISGIVRRNGFVTSLVVRLVPTGPFILVNMAAGVSGMKFPHFMAGTGLGIIPKIVVVALITTGIVSEEQSDFIRLGLIAMAVLFVVLMLAGRKYLRQFVQTSEEA